MLNDIKQSQKGKYCMVPCSGDTQSSQNHSDRKENGGCQGLRREENGELLYSISFVQLKRVLDMIVGNGCTII